MKTEDIYNLRSPIDHKKLSIEKLIRASSDHITKAKLISTSGHAFNVSDGIARWYIDGSATGATSNFGTDSGNGLSGSGSSGFGIMSRADRLEDLVGFMGPVRIHDVPLTPTEVTADWNAQKARYGY